MGFLDIKKIKIQLAEGVSLLQAVQRLRYDVYVKEFGYLSVARHSTDRLADDFDGSGLHFVATRGEELLGAIRMLLHSEKGFPLLSVMPTFKLSSLPKNTAEISHLVIAQSFRRRREDGLFGIESYIKLRDGGILPNSGKVLSSARKRRGPLLTLALFRLLFQMSKRLRLESWLMLLDRKLHVGLDLYGIPFRQIADPQGAFDGLRPCILLLEELESRMPKLHPDLWKEFNKRLEPEYRRKIVVP